MTTGPEIAPAAATASRRLPKGSRALPSPLAAALASTNTTVVAVATRGTATVAAARLNAYNKRRILCLLSPAWKNGRPLSLRRLESAFSLQFGLRVLEQRNFADPTRAVA